MDMIQYWKEIHKQSEVVARGLAKHDYDKGELANNYPCGSWEHNCYANEAYKLKNKVASNLGSET